VTKVEIGRGGIEAKFDAERAAEGEFFCELFAGMDVGETRKKGFRRHGVRLICEGREVKAIRSKSWAKGVG
jgi:hypothetical protein